MADRYFDRLRRQAPVTGPRLPSLNPHYVYLHLVPPSHETLDTAARRRLTESNITGVNSTLDRIIHLIFLVGYFLV